MKIDKEGLDISIAAGKQRIKGLNSALPWANAGSVVSGGMDLMNVFHKSGSMV